MSFDSEICVTGRIYILLTTPMHILTVTINPLSTFKSESMVQWESLFSTFLLHTDTPHMSGVKSTVNLHQCPTYEGCDWGQLTVNLYIGHCSLSLSQVGQGSDSKLRRQLPWLVDQDSCLYVLFSFIPIYFP